MCSVGGTECVAYIVVCEVSQLFAELFAVLCLLSTAETGILKKNYISLFIAFTAFVAASPVTL